MADPDRELHPSVLVYMSSRKDPQEYTLAEKVASDQGQAQATLL